ncbi:hypothetical protein QF035_005587 [Streptomyces umbrinus]|uniref:Uncharacterized protein n=1 Tax=Streptomyces umbrinus TaxID=67370 RepID=A0ABU0SWS0_9ACTN|nr:hypothetical protein [Streptomyces umbrinus]
MALSLQAIHVLGEGPSTATLMVPGGQPRAAEGALTGPLTLASLRFGTAVMGCCGLSAADGLTAYDLDDAGARRRDHRARRHRNRRQDRLTGRNRHLDVYREPGREVGEFRLLLRLLRVLEGWRSWSTGA